MTCKVTILKLHVKDHMSEPRLNTTYIQRRCRIEQQPESVDLKMHTQLPQIPPRGFPTPAHTDLMGPNGN